MSEICIIDYGHGNIASIYYALHNIGANIQVSNSFSDIKKSDKLILPGVGSYRSGFDALKKNNLDDILTEVVMFKKKPILGICLGMQLMFSHSEEGDSEGLNWLNGKIEKIKVKSREKLPHIGWNTVTDLKTNSIVPHENGELLSEYYFVHSYAFQERNEIVTHWCNYGYGFAASIESENIFGMQFHPEKSHRAGIKILSNFLKL